jgi:hypothetical protein
MLDDLDRTLEELLRRELSPNFVSPEALTPVTISFAAPDQDFTRNVSLPAIDLFLYDVRENLELRNSNWTVNRQSNGTALKQRPPVRVDCSYLLTRHEKRVHLISCISNIRMVEIAGYPCRQLL